MLRPLITFPLLLAALCAQAQWRMLDSGSTASFRGMHAVNDKIAWASGTEGTVLRTTDGGEHWSRCTVPAGAEKLDFRGVWAWDAKEAMVMSSGPADQSRVYGTTDGCAHWTLVHSNTDKDGFWDTLVFDGGNGVLVGDPVGGHFFTDLFVEGHGWSRNRRACAARQGEAAFAASNSSVFVFGPRRYILGTGGKGGPRVLLSPELAHSAKPGYEVKWDSPELSQPCFAVSVPLTSGNESSGVFSIYFRDKRHGVAVGGDYQKPNESAGTAAFTSDGGLHWTAAAQPPHGYRSSVAWDTTRKAWIAAGTNGSDVSHDDGKTWRPLDAGNWNALSLPFVVGPKGRIGILDSSALAQESPRQK